MTTRRRDIDLLIKASDSLKHLAERWREHSLRGLDLGFLEETIEDIERYTLSVRSQFCTWVAENPRLHSGYAGLSLTDLDWVIHQFRTPEDRNGSRKIQFLMLVEEKSWDKEPRFAQRDTLDVLDQVLRSGSQREKQKAARHYVVNQRGQAVLLRYMGMHTLQFSGNGPYDSQWIRWDRKEITRKQLEKLISFDIHPDTLLPIDTRRHHFNQSSLTPLFELDDTMSPVSTEGPTYSDYNDDDYPLLRNP